MLCGSAVLAISVISDRLYFGFWAFPPYQWLYFNISKSLAIFYGQMPWHYYLSQGIPLLTTTFLPFAVVGLYKSTSTSKTLSAEQSNTLKTLSFTLLTMVGALSIISHKEVRFIYPLLPILHILAAPYMTSFFTVPSQPPSDKQSSSRADGPITLRHKFSLVNLLSVNLFIAGYLSLFHQPAPISVLTFLRNEFERIHPEALTIGPPEPSSAPDELFALFLTPCHTTPWRSHLVYSTLRARALTCEPPLHTAPGSLERETYLDEADRFYLKDEQTGEYGAKFLGEEMWPLKGGGKKRGGEVPRYIVGFEGIEGTIRKFFEEGEGKEMGVELTKVWDGWNGAFNEDWRRTGRLVVWDTKVYGEKKLEQGKAGRDEL